MIQRKSVDRHEVNDGNGDKFKRINSKLRITQILSFHLSLKYRKISAFLGSTESEKFFLHVRVLTW